MKEATNFDGICLLVVDIFPLFSFLKGNSGYKYLKFFGSSGQIFFFSPRYSSTQIQKLDTEVLLKIPLDL